MHRRNFLKSAIALAAAAGLPSLELLTDEQIPDWLREFMRTGELRNQTITLYKTLEIDRRFAGCCIRNCIFNLDKTFPLGRAVIAMPGDMVGLITNVHVNDDYGRLGTLFSFNAPCPVDW